MRINNLEEEHRHFDDSVDANFAMETAMTAIMEVTQFEPQNDQEAFQWNLIGLTLKIIAQKASRFEEMQKGESFHQNN